MAAIHDIRFERLAREAADQPLPLCAEDQDYLTRHLQAVGEAFGCRAVPDVSLRYLSGRTIVRHLARLRASVDAVTLEQHLALGRLESVFRLLASAVRLTKLSASRPRRGEG